MKTSTLLLTTALGSSLSVCGWLMSENNALRHTLAEKPAVARPSPAGQRHASPLAPRESHTAAPAATQHTPAGTAPAVLTPQDTIGHLQVAAQFTVTSNEDGTVTLTDLVTLDKRHTTPGYLATLAREAQAAAMEHTTKRPGGPSWSPGQAAGPPDTETHGDYSTAWASGSPDAGREWLRLRYTRPVEVAEVNIHESYNPGAVSKVSAILPDGTQRVLWEGTGTPEAGIIERAVKVPPGIRSDQILVELDTARVPGWNEIDAVELVGRDGTRQWAAESTASSYYGQGHPGVESLTLGSLDYEGFRVR